MTNKGSNPPRLALWLLRHTSTVERYEALTGDIIERFLEGQSRRWLWRQVLVASTLGAVEAIRRRWYLFAYAISGTVAQCLLFSSVPGRGFMLPGWSGLPWPLSQFEAELGMPVIATSTGLLVLSMGLLIERSFRWASLIRTFVFSLVVITGGFYSVDLFPWLLRPVPGDPYHKALIVPVSAVVILLGLAYFVAAWLGCTPTEQSYDRESRTARP